MPSSRSRSLNRIGAPSYCSDGIVLESSLRSSMMPRRKAIVQQTASFDNPRRVLVTGGAPASSAPSWSSGCWPKAMGGLRRQLFHRHAAQHRPPARRYRARGDAPRRYLPALRRGRRDFPTSPARPRPCTINSTRCRRPRRRCTGPINMLGLAQRTKAKFFQASTSEVYGDPAVHPQVEATGAASSHRPARLLRRGQALRRNAVLRLQPPERRPHQGGAHLQEIPTTRMHPNDGRTWCRTSSSRRSRASLSPCSATAAVAIVLLRRRSRRGHPALHPRHARRLHRPDESRQSSEFTIRELAELVIELTGSPAQIEYRPLPSDDPKQRRPDISLARATIGLGTARPAARGTEPNHRLLPGAGHGVRPRTVSAPSAVLAGSCRAASSWRS